VTGISFQALPPFVLGREKCHRANSIHHSDPKNKLRFKLKDLTRMLSESLVNLAPPPKVQSADEKLKAAAKSKTVAMRRRDGSVCRAAAVSPSRTVVAAFAFLYLTLYVPYRNSCKRTIYNTTRCESLAVKQPPPTDSKRKFILANFEQTFIW